MGTGPECKGETVRLAHQAVAPFAALDRPTLVVGRAVGPLKDVRSRHKVSAVGIKDLAAVEVEHFVETVVLEGEAELLGSQARRGGRLRIVTVPDGRPGDAQGNRLVRGERDGVHAVVDGAAALDLRGGRDQAEALRGGAVGGVELDLGAVGGRPEAISFIYGSFNYNATIAIRFDLPLQRYII